MNQRNLIMIKSVMLLCSAINAPGVLKQSYTEEEAEVTIA